MALFRLAWSNKVQLPLLITVCFMAFDIRLQLEINIFWEPPRPSAARQQRDRALRIANANNEAARAAAVNAALLQRQRQRLLEERARLDNLEGLNGGRHNFPAAAYEGEQSEVYEETDTADEVDSSEDTKEESAKCKNKKKKRLRKGEEDDENNDDEEEGDRDSDDDSDSGDDDYGNGNGSGASQNPEYFGDSDRDDDFSDENSQGRGDRSGDDSDDSTGGAAPLIVELEIRQRPGFKEFTTKLCSIVTNFSKDVLLESLRSIGVPCEDNLLQQPPQLSPTQVVHLPSEELTSC
jgi:hypothetical protein